MGKMKRVISHQMLLAALHYEPITGLFTWRAPRPKILVGQCAGYFDKKGRRAIEINGRAYFAHRLAWFYMTKKWPKDQIDHRNRIPDDNRFENLREATNAQNRANSRTNSRHGMKGVTRHSWLKEKPYEARITFNKRVRSLGCFATVEEAHQAYCQEAKKLHGEFFNPL